MDATDHPRRPAPVSTGSPLGPIGAAKSKAPTNSVLGATDPTNKNAPPLSKLRRSIASNEPAAFGSIRFPARAMPAKFVHLAPDSAEDVVVSLLVDTWRLVPPCAILALNPPSVGPFAAAAEEKSRTREAAEANLMLRQGLADVARKTNAWVFSCGERSNQGAQVAGHAKAYGAKLGYTESPYIAVVAAGRMREELTDKSHVNGKVHRYSAAAIEPADALKVDLDSSHTHFIVVDGTQEDAEGLRDRLEYYLSSNDVSGDGIQTPKLLVVIGGGPATLKWVRNGLDKEDEATQTAVPVLVIAKSGGAASDIWRYCCPGPNYLKPIEAGGERDEAYLAACAKWLPEIERLGKKTGNNTTKQLTFFNFDENDPDAENDLALAIEEALLNDCPNINQEAMLAVAWGEAVILQRHLESNAVKLLTPESKPGADDDADLLQIALQRQDVDVVSMLLKFDELNSSRVVMDELFMEKFNRYPVKDTRDMWMPLPETRGPSQPGTKEGSRPSSPYDSTRGRRRPSLSGLSMVKVAPQNGEASDDAHTAGSSSFRSRSPSMSSIRRMSSFRSPSIVRWAPGWDHAYQVLRKMVDGYGPHLKVRRGLGTTLTEHYGEEVRVEPTFTDLMMWAVLADQPINRLSTSPIKRPQLYANLVK